MYLARLLLYEIEEFQIIMFEYKKNVVKALAVVTCAMLLFFGVIYIQVNKQKLNSGIFIYNGANRKEMYQSVFIPLDAYKALKDILDGTR